MKTSLVVALVIALAHVGQAQSLTVHKTDQTTVNIPLSEIDSITFTAQSGPCPPTVSWGGKIYNTVLIGTQCWFRENLDIGTMVPGSQNQANNSVFEKYCYNNSLVNCDTYGGLYQWNEAMQYDTTQGVQGICPPGWHIPTLAEFQTLSSAVGGGGNALKRQDQGIGGGQGTNTSGFSALLAGARSGYFWGLGVLGYFWSSTQHDASSASNLGLNGFDEEIILVGYYYPQTWSFSVRCLED